MPVDAQVKRIRRAFLRGAPIADIAAKEGLSASTIRRRLKTPKFSRLPDVDRKLALLTLKDARGATELIARFIDKKLADITAGKPLIITSADARNLAMIAKSQGAMAFGRLFIPAR